MTNLSDVLEVQQKQGVYLSPSTYWIIHENMSYLVGPRVNYLVFYSSLGTSHAALTWNQYNSGNVLPHCYAVQQWHTTSNVTVENWISDTVLLNLNLPFKFVDIISLLRRNAAWIKHEGLHGIFMEVQLILVQPSRSRSGKCKNKGKHN